jgi:hypothetical protein
MVREVVIFLARIFETPIVFELSQISLTSMPAPQRLSQTTGVQSGSISLSTRRQWALLEAYGS